MIEALNIQPHMIVPIAFGIMGFLALGAGFWFLISHMMFSDEQKVKQELHEQAMNHGTDAQGSATSLRKALVRGDYE